MDNELVDPLEINKHPKIIKEAQAELGKLDILVCGQCHMVFHFVEQFHDHRTMANCSGSSSIRENNINESKAQVWAFLLWKGAQQHEENENSWLVYQKWCKMDGHIKEAWVVAGRNVQVFTKLSAAKMQEVRTKTVRQKPLFDDEPLEEGEIKDPLADSDEGSDMDSELDTEEEAEKEELEKMKDSVKSNNGSLDDDRKDGSDEKDEIQTIMKKIHMNSAVSITTTQKKPQGIPLVMEKSSRMAVRTDKINNTEKESVIEKILAKRFNPRRKMHEYLIKWEGCSHDQNTWEPPSHLDTCKHLLEAFERNLARQKEAKAAAQAALLKQQKAQGKHQAGPSGITTLAGGRPQRTSKQKALDQVKQWCGNISDRDDDLGYKRRGSSDSDDDPDEKKIKLEFDSGSEDEWQADEEEIERHTTVGRPKILQKSTSVINGMAKKQMTANEVARSIGLASPDRPTSPPLLLTNNKGVVKVYKNQMPNLATGVYIMSKKDGIVKLESSPNLIATNNANIVRVQKTSVGGAPTTTNIIRVAPKINSNQPMRVLAKSNSGGGAGGVVTSDSAATGNAVRLSPGMSRTGTPVVPKIKTTIKPAVRMTTGVKERLQPQRMQIGTPQLKVVRSMGRPPAKPLPPQPQPVYQEPADDIDKHSDSSDDDFDPFPKDLPPPAPDSPPREFTLDPMTGLILGQAEGEPEPQLDEPEPDIDQQEEEQQQSMQDTEVDGAGDHGEVLGATKVTVKQESEVDGQTNSTSDMPSLMLTDSSMEESNSMTLATTTLSDTTTTITIPETGDPIMITGEDGVLYQVAGQNEEGHTLLVAQGVDGQQQCVYVTGTTDDGQVGVDGTVLTLDSAVAEAMGETAVISTADGVQEQLTVDTGMEGVDQGEMGDDGNSQVVAQLVKAELPSPGGTRKVVLLLPDGNLLMTEVDAEQYAALELDK